MLSGIPNDFQKPIDPNTVLFNALTLFNKLEVMKILNTEGERIEQNLPRTISPGA